MHGIIYRKFHKIVYIEWSPLPRMVHCALALNCVSLTTVMTVKQLWVMLVPMASAAASAGDVTPVMRPLIRGPLVLHRSPAISNPQASMVRIASAQMEPPSSHGRVGRGSCGTPPSQTLLHSPTPTLLPGKREQRRRRQRGRKEPSTLTSKPATISCQ